MVVITYSIGTEKHTLYMDGELYNQLTRYVIPDVQKKDFDYVIMVDGEERSGKSVFAMQIAKVLDPNFNLSNVCFTPEDFIKAVTKAKPHSCIVFDEAFTGLSSRGSLTEINQLLVSMMMEMGQKNLFIIIVMPSFFMLDKYIVFHRARGLFNVHMRNGKRGFWKFYDKFSMKRLHLIGRKYYEYLGVNPIMFGRFLDHYTVSEEEYRKSKNIALKKKNRSTKVQVYKEQRDLLLYILYKDFKKTQLDISKVCYKYGFKVARNTISEIVSQKSREMLKEG